LADAIASSKLATQRTGEIDLRRRRVHDLADRKLRGGVDYRGAGSAGTRDQTAIDQMMTIEIFEGIECVHANSFD